MPWRCSYWTSLGGLGLVLQAVLRGNANGIVDLSQLQIVASLQAAFYALVSVAVFMAFLPALLSRLGGVPSASVAYRGDWKRSQIFVLSIAALLLDYALHQGIDWMLCGEAADPKRAKLLSDLATALLSVLLPVLFALVFWRLLWRPEPQAAAVPAGA